MTVVGGTLADQLGYKPVILSGLAIRAVGFGLLGLAESFPAVLVAAIMAGFGSALFGPGLRAYLAVEGKDQRSEVFARDDVPTRAIRVGADRLHVGHGQNRE